MHTHHIIPKHAGGKDGPTVRVTVAEHADMHRILYEKHGRQQDYIAWKALSGQIDKYELNRLRAMLPKSEEHKKNISLAWKNRAPMTEETREKMRISHLGKPSPNKGRKNPGVSASNRRRTPWNRGLTKADPRVARNVARMAATRYGGK